MHLAWEQFSGVRKTSLLRGFQGVKSGGITHFYVGYR
jgi:hypothetical protein